MLARIIAIVAPEHAVELAAASERARGVPQPTLAAMAERTLAHYDAAVAADLGRGMRACRRSHWTRVRAAEGKGALRPRGAAAMSAANECADWVARGRTHQWEGRPGRRDAVLPAREPRRSRCAGSALRAGRSAVAVGPPARRGRRLARGGAARCVVSRAMAGDFRGAARDGRRSGRARGGRARPVARARQRARATDSRHRRALVGRLGGGRWRSRVRSSGSPRSRRADTCRAARARTRSRRRRSKRAKRCSRVSRAHPTCSPMYRSCLPRWRSSTRRRKRATRRPRCARRSWIRCAHGGSVRPISTPWRRIAVATAGFDAAAASEFAARYAAWCAASLAPNVPSGWPRRVAGAPTRIVACW